MWNEALLSLTRARDVRGPCLPILAAAKCETRAFTTQVTGAGRRGRCVQPSPGIDMSCRKSCYVLSNRYGINVSGTYNFVIYAVHVAMIVS